MAIPKKYRYDPSAVLGSNCPINIVTGARSLGKTYGWKKICIKAYLDKGWTWGYLRTFDQEIRDLLSDGPEAFFSDIMRNDEFPGYTFRCMGRLMQIAKKDKDGKPKKWETMGQLLALTKSQNYKGKAVATMHYVMFDEFIRETRVPPYPRGCVDMLMGLWETLDRRENRIKIIMLANAADIVNPYFVEWHITPPEPGKCKKVPVGASKVFVQNCWSKEFEKAADESNIGKFTRGSKYARYAQMNQFRNDTSKFIENRPKRTQATRNIRWGEQMFCIWMDLSMNGKMYVTGKACKDVSTLALMKEDMEPDYYLIERSDPILKSYARIYRNGLMRFESVQVREQFCDVLTMCGIR